MHIIKLPSGTYVNLEGIADADVGDKGVGLRWPTVAGGFLLTFTGDDGQAILAELERLAEFDVPGLASEILSYRQVIKDFLRMIEKPGKVWMNRDEWISHLKSVLDGGD